MIKIFKTSTIVGNEWRMQRFMEINLTEIFLFTLTIIVVIGMYLALGAAILIIAPFYVLSMPVIWFDKALKARIAKDKKYLDDEEDDHSIVSKDHWLMIMPKAKKGGYDQ